MVEVEVEEDFFIPDNNMTDSDSDENAIPLNTKIYATRSKTITKNQLIEENLNQIVENKKKEKFSNKLEEKIHYLQLDLANKELELIDLNYKLEHQTKIVNLMNNFENAFRIIEENKEKYQEIIKNIENSSHIKYLEGVNMYFEVSKNSPPNLKYESNVIPLHVQYILLETYNQKCAEDYRMKEKVQSIVLDYKANHYKRILHTMLMAGVITIILYALYAIYKW
jgi:hypothetical protein